MNYKNLILMMIASPLLVGESNNDINSEALRDRVFNINKTKNIIVIDGIIDEEEWKNVSKTSDFREFQPGDNIIPTKKTEVMVTYDQSNLYVAFKANSDLSQIRASMQKRDEVFRDDFVAILLDTYGDANSAVMIGSNPLGVQLDALNQGDDDDAGYDVIFKSAGKITDNGYQVELSIPFSSLSFPKKKIQEWKVTFFRNLPRENRHMIVWGGFDRANPCWLCQMGTLTGIQEISQSGKLEYLPTIVGSQSSGLDANNSFEKQPYDGDLSLGIKYSFSSDRVAEISINPDFSQVEADEEQIDVNTTFALNYPEKRPFFNEGSDLTDTWVNVIHTRSINNPTSIGRLINRGQKDSWVFLSALDENSPYIVPSEEQSFTRMGKKSYSNIFRYKRSLNQGSFLGLVATNRKMLDNEGSGTILGFDSRYRFNEKYQVEFQAVYSHTNEPNDSLLVESKTFGEDYSYTFDGESFSGNALEIEFQRNTEHWRLEAGYDHRSPTFRAENGFVTNVNQRRIYSQSLWTYFPNNFFSQIVGGFHAGIEPNYNGITKSKYFVLFGNLAMPYQTRLNISYARRPLYRFKETNLTGTWDLRIRLNSQFSERYQFGVNIGRHVAPVRFLEVPDEGRMVTNNLWVRIQATDRLNFGLSHNYQKMTTMDRNTDYFSGYVSSIRIKYQHNKSLGFKMFGQYNDFNKTFQIQPLLIYQPSPFTIFYIGSNSYQEMNSLAINMLNEGTLTQRQYFMKLQYLF